MNIEIIQAKNGELTAKSDSLFLHSSYSPSNEAKKFVENLSPLFTPKFIILLEPGLNYIFPLIKQKFPQSKIGIVRYSKAFDKYNYDSSFVYFYDNSNNFQNFLLFQLGEENLCSSFFVSWNASANAFSETDKSVWKDIKNSTEKAKTLLVTREYFEKKWLINTCKNISTISNVYLLKEKIELPFLIIASGPSLKSKIEYIKKIQNKFFIICVSSAISVLLHNEIIPDLCFTTDGGFWAGEHLKRISSQKLNPLPPLALALEGFCPSKLSSSLPIVPLNYADGISSKIIQKAQFPSMKAIRNGTVTGTALDFALSHCTKEIFLFGADMAVGKEFQHTQPNENELNNAIKDSKIRSLEKRAFISSCNKASLEVYVEWFSNKKVQSVFRIIENNEKQNSFTYIKDISLNVFSAKIENYPSVSKNTESFFIKKQLKKKDISSFILESINTQEVQKQLFPLDYVSISHENSDKNNIILRMNKKNEQLVNKIRKIFNGN